MRKIASHITIAASTERVWQVLTHLNAYADWNPFITSASGSLEAGSKLNVTILPAGGKAMSFKPVVLIARPYEELRWKGQLIVPGLFDGEHYFQLAQTQGGTVLTHGEDFSGLLVPLVGSGLFTRTEKGFAAMNDAIKRRAESGSTP